MAPDMYLPKMNDSWPRISTVRTCRRLRGTSRASLCFVGLPAIDAMGLRLHFRRFFWTVLGLPQCDLIGTRMRTIFCFAWDRLGWGTSIRTHSAWKCGLMAAS